MIEVDYSGRLYGRLKVLKNLPKSFCECVCICGKLVKVNKSNLKSGKTKSCGCLHHDNLIKRNTTHGKSTLPEYFIWQSLKYRCLKKSCKLYKYYGERGIKICKKWSNSFKNFYNSMGPRPSSKHTLDRINTNKGYSSKNCRWTTWKVQQNNRRNNHLVTYAGVTKTISDWANCLGMEYHTLESRIVRYNWPVEKALLTLVGKTCL